MSELQFLRRPPDAAVIKLWLYWSECETPLRVQLSAASLGFFFFILNLFCASRVSDLSDWDDVSSRSSSLSWVSSASRAPTCSSLRCTLTGSHTGSQTTVRHTFTHTQVYFQWCVSYQFFSCSTSDAPFTCRHKQVDSHFTFHQSWTLRENFTIKYCYYCRCDEAIQVNDQHTQSDCPTLPKEISSSWQKNIIVFLSINISKIYGCQQWKQSIQYTINTNQSKLFQQVHQDINQWQEVTWTAAWFSSWTFSSCSSVSLDASAPFRSEVRTAEKPAVIWSFITAKKVTGFLVHLEVVDPQEAMCWRPGRQFLGQLLSNIVSSGSKHGLTESDILAQTELHTAHS